jgi:hypothetical protein
VSANSASAAERPAMQARLQGKRGAEAPEFEPGSEPGPCESRRVGSPAYQRVSVRRRFATGARESGRVGAVWPSRGQQMRSGAAPLPWLPLGGGHMGKWGIRGACAASLAMLALGAAGCGGQDAPKQAVHGRLTMLGSTLLGCGGGRGRVQRYQPRGAGRVVRRGRDGGGDDAARRRRRHPYEFVTSPSPSSRSRCVPISTRWRCRTGGGMSHRRRGAP